MCDYVERAEEARGAISLAARRNGMCNANRLFSLHYPHRARSSSTYICALHSQRGERSRAARAFAIKKDALSRSPLPSAAATAATPTRANYQTANSHRASAAAIRPLDRVCVLGRCEERERERERERGELVLYGIKRKLSKRARRSRPHASVALSASLSLSSSFALMLTRLFLIFRNLMLASL